MKKNLLLKSENLNGLNYLLDNNFSNKVDLIYIDPPFSTNNVFTIGSGRASTISRTKTGKIAYTDNLKGEDFISTETSVTISYCTVDMPSLKDIPDDRSDYLAHTKSSDKRIHL